MTTRALPAFALAAGTLALAACGSSGSGSGSSGSKPSSSSSSSGSKASSDSGPGSNAYGGAAVSKPASASATASGSASAGALKLTAQESGGLSFDQKTLKAKAGKVTIVMTNPSGDSLPHAIAVEGNGVDKDGPRAQPGGSSTLALTLKPGKYEFYCPVDGHKAAGMKGTLIVR